MQPTSPGGPLDPRSSHLEDAAQALNLAPPTQRLLASLLRRSQRWPGQPMYERFEVLQEEAKILDLDFAHAVEELHRRGIASFGCSEDASTDTAGIAYNLRYRFIHSTLDEPRKLNVALIQMHCPQTVRAAHEDGDAEGTLRPSARTTAIPKDEPPSPDCQSSKGWVYVLRAGLDYKIGKTTRLDQRMARLRIQLPDKSEVVHTIATNDIHWVERHWHNHFASKRRNGEWFRLSPEEVQEMKALLRMDVEREQSEAR